jgi:hypothetical protein
VGAERPVSVAERLEDWLAGRDLTGQEEVLAEIGRVLAAQLDATHRSGTARGLNAGPALGRRLMEVLNELGRREAAEAAREAEEAVRAERLEQKRRMGRWAAEASGR